MTGLLRAKSAAAVVRMLACSVHGALAQAVDALTPLSSGVGAQAVVARDCLHALAALGPFASHKVRGPFACRPRLASR